MSFNKVYLLISLLVFGFTCQSQTIIPGGYVSGTWDASGNPYHIMGTISIHEDSTLLIETDVEIYFADSAHFDVYGILLADGAYDYIIFDALDSIWGGIRIHQNDNTNDSILFSFCEIDKGRSIGNNPDGGGLWIKNRDAVIIKDCIIWHCYAEEKGGGVYIENSDIHMENTKVGINTTGTDILKSRGGGIYLYHSSPLMIDVDMKYNEAMIGGGLYASGSSPTIIKSAISDNISNAGGGALVFHDSGHVVLENNLFYGNEANGSGGAIAFLEGIHAELNACSFLFNISSSSVYLADGGAVFISPYDNEVIIKNCEFTSNRSGDFGGAIYAASETYLVNCQFGDNRGTGLFGGGGAVAVMQSSLISLNCTFCLNNSPNGTSLYCEDSESTLLNSIIWDGPLIEGNKVILAGYETNSVINIDHCDIEGGMDHIDGIGNYSINWMKGNINDNPNFVSALPDVSLKWNSPCINAGRSDTLLLLIPPYDFSGHQRIIGGEIDMGCYEYQGPNRIPEISKEEQFVVYPNPATDHFYLKNISQADFEGRMRLTDLSGKLLIENKLIVPAKGIFLQSLLGLVSGYYIIQLDSPGYSAQQKIIVW